MRLWWKPRRSDEAVRWDSAIVLGHDFFNEILAAPVPIDMQVLRELNAQLPRPRPVPVADLPPVPARPPALSHVAAGVPAVRASPGSWSPGRSVKDFRRDVLRELGKIRIAWPQLSYSTPKGLLVLRPSPPRVSPEISTEAL